MEADRSTPWCAALARALDEPLPGTASVAPRWVCVEHRGTWPHEITQHRDDAVRAFLARASTRGMAAGAGPPARPPAVGRPHAGLLHRHRSPGTADDRAAHRRPRRAGVDRVPGARRPVAGRGGDGPDAARLHARPARPLLRRRRPRARPGGGRDRRVGRLGVHPPRRPPLRPDGAGAADGLPLRAARRRGCGRGAQGSGRRRGGAGAVSRAVDVDAAGAGRRAGRARRDGPARGGRAAGGARRRRRRDGRRDGRPAVGGQRAPDLLPGQPPGLLRRRGAAGHALHASRGAACDVA